MSESSSQSDESGLSESSDSEDRSDGSSSPSQTPALGSPSFHTSSQDLKDDPDSDHVPLHALPRKYVNNEMQRAYQDLLRGVGQDTVNPSNEHGQVLPGSQIDAVSWSSTEKETFFQALSRTGLRNLPALSKAIETKTVVEILAYLRLLQRAETQLQTVPSSKRIIARPIIPAACDISEECERALEALADDAARHDDEQCYQEAASRYGEHWLIDGDLAERLEMQYEHEQSSENQHFREMHGDAGQATNASKRTLSNDNRFHSHELSNQHRENTGFVENPSAKTVPLCDATRLFKPVTFLRLSDALCMNGPPGSGSNWTDLVDSQSPAQGPAMVRTVLDDFLDLTRSFTQKLLKRTLFQAMTRIRAMDSRHDRMPDMVVRPCDVHIACKTWNKPAESRQYWAKVARLNKVDVYTNSERYSATRKTRKNGAMLTYDEVETELGFPPKISATQTEATNTPDDVSSDMSFSGDEWTDEDLDQTDLEHSDALSDASSSSDSSSLSSTSVPPRPIAGRKRALSLRDHIRAETRLLERADHQASSVEEHNLWKHVLRRPKPAVADEGASPPDASPPTPILRDLVPERDWAQRTQYIGPWERSDGLPAPDKFHEMEIRGVRGRKRRKLAREHAQISRDNAMTDQDARDRTVLKHDESEESSDQESEHLAKRSTREVFRESTDSS